VETAELAGLSGIWRSDAYRSSRLISRAAMICFAAQLLGLLGYSYFIFHRFSLGIDFAIYSQAFAEIGRGHLNPFSTILGYSYLHSHFELIMWPLALLYTVFRSSFILLVVQDVSLVGVGVVTFLWVSKLVVSRALSTRIAVVALVGTLVLILLDPLVYFTAALDFHFEATVTFFAVFAAYDVWGGRTRRAFIWVAVCLLCGDIGGLYVLGVGVSAILASRSTRRTGVVLLLVGLVWVGVISSIGANKGSFTDGYAYLAGRAVLPAGFGGALALLGGIVTHPTRATHMLTSRASYIGQYLSPGGFIGLATPWGFGVPAVVLLTSTLQATTLFIGEPYQQFAVFPFVLFGSVSLLTYLASNRSRRPATRHHRPTALPSGWRWVAAVGAVGVAASAVVYAERKLPEAPKANAAATFIPAGEAAVLRSVLSGTPSATQVIVSLPISGRFGERKYVYLYEGPTTPVPMNARTVMLVLDTGHTLQLASPGQDSAAAQYVQRHFHARTVAQGEDIWVLEWAATSPSPPIALP
jgi:hypothetical protein